MVALGLRLKLLAQMRNIDAQVLPVLFGFRAPDFARENNRRTCTRADARLRRIYLEVRAANPSPGIRAGVDLVSLAIAEASPRQALTLFCGCVVKVRLIVWQIGFRSTRFSRFQWCRSGPGRNSPLFNC